MRDISIIVITHQKGILLEKTLEALKQQTNSEDEIIVIDDGGKDKQVVSSILGMKGYIQVEHKGYRLAQLTNMGIKRAHHSAVAKLDGDCVPQRGWLDTIKKELSGHPDALILGRIEWQKKTGQLLQDNRFSYTTRSLHESLDESIYPQRTWGGNIAAMFSVWKKLGGFNEQYDGSWGAEEADLGWRAYRMGLELRFVFDALVIHQDHPPCPSRLTHVANYRLLEENKKLYEQGEKLSLNYV
jgi:GT2 family glycosyltransferase